MCSRRLTHVPTAQPFCATAEDELTQIQAAVQLILARGGGWNADTEVTQANP